MQLTLDRLFASPDFHFFAFERDHGVFAQMDRAAYRRSIFLDARIQPANPQMLQVPMAPMLQVLQQRQLRPQRTGWIFHVAQCGSTLLARALDGDAHLVLREPTPLRQLGVAGSAGGAAGLDLQLRLAATMAGRRYATDQLSIVKATVPVNFILPRIAALDPSAPAIFLYFAFQPYLQAVLRGPNHRQWVQRVTTELAGALAAEAGDLAGLGDAERAAALWLAQMRAFAAALTAMPESRSLDAEMLFNDPRPVIAAASALFGQPMPADQLDALLAGDLFATYSKNPGVRFDNEARKARQAEVARTLAPEIDRARAWLAPRLAANPLPERLAKPLAGTSPSLL